MEPIARRGRIPLHRSVRHVAFKGGRLAAWSLAAIACTVLMLVYHRALLEGYRGLVEGLLRAAGVPFANGVPARLGFLRIPAWRVESFNPIAHWSGALPYGAASLVLLFAPRLPRMPLPVGSWLSLVGGLMLLTTLVLYWRPVPVLTPASFSGLWGQITVGTALLFPWIWALLVGVLPLPPLRVALWGLLALAVFLLWNGVRLAFFLALARAAGVVWLPPALILGCTLPDFMVLVIAFGRVLEPAGASWEEVA